MCVTSMVGDAYGQRWPHVYPNVYPGIVPSDRTFTVTTGVSRQEFDALKREVEEMKELLKAAQRIDELTGQADCDNEEKLAVLRTIAEMVGVDLDDVLGAKP